MHVEQLRTRLKEKNYDLAIDQKVINLLARDGFDPEYGARPVRRIIQHKLEDAIAEHILKGVFNPGDVIRVVRKSNDELEFVPGEKAEAGIPVEEEETVGVEG